MDNQNIAFGVIGNSYGSSNPRYDYTKKIIAYCQHSGKPIREGEDYLETQEGVILRDDKFVLIEYFNLHRVTQYSGEINE